MKVRRHIGLITPSLNGVTGRGSGIGVHFRHLADGLVSAGHAVTCIVPTTQALPVPNDLPFRVISAEASPSALTTWVGRFSWQLHQALMVRARHRAVARAAASCTEVDVWETTSTESPALDFLRVRPRAPVFTRVSTTASQLLQHNAGRATWISRRLEQWEAQAIRRSDAVITHTPGHRATLAAEFGLDPTAIRLVPHGIPLPPPPPPRPPSDAPRLLYVGRLEHRKGIDLLLAALPVALASHPRATIDLVGADSGDYWQNRWRATAPSALFSRVRFRGLLPDEELNRAYAEADIFVAPSRYESFGLIFVEAMARALPVVALATPGALDLVEPEVNGLLATPEDASALAAALVRLLANPAFAARLGQAGRQHAEERYGLDALVAASLASYEELIARRP